MAENPEVMVEISDRVLVAAGLKPAEESSEAGGAETFTDADESPIELD